MGLLTARSRAEHDKPGDQEVRGVSASAQRLPLSNRKALKAMATRRQEWQDEGWDYFDDVPEIKNTTWLGGNVMSKLRLYCAVRPIDDPEGDPIPVTDPESGVPIAVALRAVAELERIKSPLGGRPEIIRAFSMNLEIAGELYLHMRGPRVVREEDDAGAVTAEYVVGEEWNVRSVDEVEVMADGKSVRVHKRPGDKGEDLDPNIDACIRIWQRHPRWSYLPDCNMRGVLSDCEALVLLSNQVKASAKSAASAGLLLLPSELNYHTVKHVNDDGDDVEDDPFLDMVNEQLTAPIEDPSSAASVSPAIVRGESAHLKEVRHLTLERKADEHLEARIEARVVRIARGLNYPVETVLGHMNTTFANAAQITADLFRDHYEPKCITLVDCVTVGMLQPNLMDAGVDPTLAERIFVWFDPEVIIRSVDPLESADHGYDIGTISDAAWRQRKGWTEDDAPTPQERLVRAVLRLRALDPGISTALVELLGVPLNVPAVVPAGETIGEGVEQPIDAPIDTPGPPMTMEQALVEVLVMHQRRQQISTRARDVIEPALAEGGLKAALAAHNNPGRQLMDIDRNLRAKLLVSADRALTRALERAGNRLKAKADSRLRSIVRTTHPVYAAQQLGPKLVASSGFTDDDLIGGDAWDALEHQFLEWGAGAQRRAIEVANKVVGLSAAERSDLQVRQARDLTEAWTWTRDQLHELALQRLYAPDPHDPSVGEFDPSTKVPTGLVRQAVARAGGASGLTVQDTNPYVVINNANPPGGIGTGELIMGALTDAGAGVEAYEWTYGPAYRLRPFEEHEALDGETFGSFDDDKLTAGDWIGDYYFPGDHDGCNCDFTPVIVDAAEGVSANEVTGEPSQIIGD